MSGEYHIIGGGLAGLTVAWELAKSMSPDPVDKRIHVYEALDRFGGKAGSNLVNRQRNSGYSDHGYHLFPEWYRLVRSLMGELGIDYDAIAVTGERFGPLLGASSLTNVPALSQPPINGRVFTRDTIQVDTKTRAVVTEPKLLKGLALAVTVSHLITARESKLRGRSVKEAIEEWHPLLAQFAMSTFENMILKAFSGKSERTSAISIARFFRRWSDPLSALWSPSYSSLDGSLERRLIAELVAGLRARGVDVESQLTLKSFDAGTTKRSLTFLDESETPPKSHIIDVSEDTVVLAVPPGVIAKTCQSRPDLVEPASELAQMTTQFSGVDIYFKNGRNVPREHFGFAESAITAYDISTLWSNQELVFPWPTVLQLVVPETTGGRAKIAKKVRTECGVLDFKQRGDHWHINVNAESKLSLANVRCHDHAEALQAISDRIYVAGDYMPTSMGVPSMEGAVGSGLRVAHRILDPDSDPDPFGRRGFLIWMLGALARIIGVLERTIDLVSLRKLRSR